jgi:LmbE family N-acetylglucosaminyl deacetylase
MDVLPPLLVISPHLDDAVFSCGQLLEVHPGATVVTIFAGRPPPGTPLTDWDSAAGFGPGEDPIGRRREVEKRTARLWACSAHGPCGSTSWT